MAQGVGARARLLPRAAWWVAACVALACSPEAPRPRNAVLISLDTVRSDMLGSYGYARPSSPNLDALAAAGALFEDARSTAPWTLPSHASLLTGRWGPRHGLTSVRKRLPDSVTPLPEWLARHGFATGAVVNSRLVGERNGLDRGFRSFESVPERARSEAPHAVLDRAVAWLAEAPEPFFLFVHHYQAHSPYQSLARFREGIVRPYSGPVDGSGQQLLLVRSGELQLGEDDVAHLTELYAAGIRQVDEEVGGLMRELARRGLLDRTLVVVTSDHGEEFLEHGGVLHGLTQYEELLRVPLILRGPGIPAGRRIDTPVSGVDVMPTILSLVGVPAPAGLDGIDLTPLLAGDGGPPAERPLFSDADHRNATDDRLASVRRGRFKLILDRETGGARLFDLEADPGERVDASPVHPEVAAALRAEVEALERTRIEAPEGRALTPAEAEQLRALGYLQDLPPDGGGTPTSGDSPTPEDAGSRRDRPGSDRD